MNYKAFRYWILLCGMRLLFSCNPSQKPNKQASQTEVGQDSLSRKELIAEVKNLYFNDQKYRRVIGILEDKCYPDSTSKATSAFYTNNHLAGEIIYRAQSKLDMKDTEKLIDLTKKYGFPGMKHQGHDIPIFLVFVHSQKKYWKEIRELIIKEYKAGRVSDFGKDYIFWHLNGRKGRPPTIPHPINYRTSTAIFKGALKMEDEKKLSGTDL